MRLQTNSNVEKVCNDKKSAVDKINYCMKGELLVAMMGLVLTKRVQRFWFIKKRKK